MKTCVCFKDAYESISSNTGVAWQPPSLRHDWSVWLQAGVRQRVGKGKEHSRWHYLRGKGYVPFPWLLRRDVQLPTDPLMWAGGAGNLYLWVQVPEFGR